MYQVSIFNNGVETVVHYPSNDPEDPHISKLPLKEGLSVVDTLSFTLFSNNQGYNNVYELTTKVKVLDLRDNTTRFTGRILDINENMDSDGKTVKEITCEGALSFLNDTKQRGSSYVAVDPQSFLTQILDNHNSKVESSKQIFVGNVNVTGSVAHTNSYKTTLAEILLVRDDIGGEIRIRESNGILYLDWLQSLNTNTVEVSLGVNMKDMVVSKDVTSLGTRIIPLGANNLTIETVNGGLDYIEDVSAKSIYGVIEKTVEYKDISDATELFNTCSSELSTHTQPSYVLKTNALDLSYITGNKNEQFVLGTYLHLINQLMGVDDTYSITEISLDLIQPYNPTLTISNKSVTMTNTINDLRQTTIQNDGVYNNVQIGSSFGIRAIRSDNKVVLTINATEGITIENENEKVFSVDLDGNLVVNKGTFNQIRAIGGRFTNIVCDEGLLIEDGDVSCYIDALGIKLVGSTGKEANIQILDDGTYSGTYIRDDLYVEDTIRVFGKSRFEDSSQFYKNVTIDGVLHTNSDINATDIDVSGTLNASNIEVDGIPLDMYVNGLIYEAGSSTSE